ncbi:MAG: ferritin family protein [Patescibacteria group bacterium]|nr:ferritin family protein [Patescibacteria group bacterium]
MKSFRCTICGELFLGSKLPSHCPFCGVKAKYILNSEEVNGAEIFMIKNISDESRKSLIVALNKETSNASFYKCASDNGEKEEIRILFNRLAKIEREHANIIGKFLDLDAVEFTDQECSHYDSKNLEQALESTKEIVKFYKKASIEAREVKISNLFKALGEVEESCYKMLSSFGSPEIKKDEHAFVPPLYFRVRGK